MKEQLISFETAKLAKEEGFNERVKKSYSTDKKVYEQHNRTLDLTTPIFDTDYLEKYWNSQDIFKAPTQSLLQKWLREKQGIHIVLIPTVNSNWTYKTTTVLSERDDEIIIGIKDVGDLPPYKDVCGEDFSTYEKALESGLQEALKLIP